MNSSDSKSVEIQRRIHLGNLLGEGGMGRVVDGFAADLGQYLAVKHLHLDLHTDPESRDRFVEEASIMASIDHPGVLPIYGSGHDEGAGSFYVMKKVDGRTLEEVITASNEPLSSLPRRQRLLGILLEVCNTLATAHARGIIHRDIKPANILIDREGSVYVIDWGLAKRTGTAGASPGTERTISGKVMGTPGYMAPEQVEGRAERAGAEADVFALGVILYEMLTGKRPFAAESSRAEMLGAIHQDPEDPRRTNILIPRDISAICLKALHKNPASRYPNARGLADDLRAHLEGRPVSVVKPNLIEKIRFASRRRPMRALLITSLLLTLLALTAFIGTQRLIDHRLANKAMARLAVIDAEIAELDHEASRLGTRLRSEDLPDAERSLLTHDLGLLDARWILGQFEAIRVLSSVIDLRFIKTDSDIHALTRKRLLSVVQTAIDRGKLPLAEAAIATLLERAEDGTLASKLTPEDLQLLQRLADEARRKTISPKP